MNTLFKLASYHHSKTSRLRSHFFRHRHLLQLPCHQLEKFAFTATSEDLPIIRQMAQDAPLLASDLDEKSSLEFLNKHPRWPNDRAFYKNLLQQLEIWRRFSNRNLLEFLESDLGQKWYASRSRMSRIPLYELDCPYRATRPEVFAHELRVKALLRTNPLLRFSDLKALGIANAQKILENYPALVKHRRTYLERLKSSLRKGLGR